MVNVSKRKKTILLFLVRVGKNVTIAMSMTSSSYLFKHAMIQSQNHRLMY